MIRRWGLFVSFWCSLGLVVFFPLGWPTESTAETPYVTLASTTSTQNSGLYDFLLPHFTEANGIAVRVVAVGTGQALRLGERGDADLLLVHHPDSEERFMAAGFGVDRRPVMHNYFVLIGPDSDPAGAAAPAEMRAALHNIADKKQIFLSRGDDSGTHRLERALWQAAGIDVAAASGTWYRESGSGMGATLNMASAMNAYTISDRGTWLNFKNKGTLVVLSGETADLKNPYHVIMVNPARHPHVKADLARQFMDWITGVQAQGLIDAYRIDGETLFFPAK